jgi:hypothetical protein
LESNYSSPEVVAPLSLEFRLDELAKVEVKNSDNAKKIFAISRAI